MGDEWFRVCLCSGCGRVPGVGWSLYVCVLDGVPGVVGLGAWVWGLSRGVRVTVCVSVYRFVITVCLCVMSLKDRYNIYELSTKDKIHIMKPKVIYNHMCQFSILKASVTDLLASLL